VWDVSQCSNKFHRLQPLKELSLRRVPPHLNRVAAIPPRFKMNASAAVYITERGGHGMRDAEPTKWFGAMCKPFASRARAPRPDGARA